MGIIVACGIVLFYLCFQDDYASPSFYFFFIFLFFFSPSFYVPVVYMYFISELWLVASGFI